MNIDFLNKQIEKLNNFHPEDGDSPEWYQNEIFDMMEEFEDFPKLWCYSNPGVMKGHKYSDDVALCYALNKEHAMITFRQMYSHDILEGHVQQVLFNRYGIFVATSY